MKGKMVRWYAVFNQKTEYDGTGESLPIKTESFTNGLAYNSGLGVSNFVSPNAAFEITGRWEDESLIGDMENYDATKSDINLKLGNTFILSGFRIFLR